MPIEITAAAAGANILAHVAEKRLVGRCEPPELHHPRQKWLDPVSLLEAIHLDIKGSRDCPTSLMPQWLADCTMELFDGVAKKDIYPIAVRYGKLLAADMMAKADDTLRDRWLVFVIKEALASARQIAITNKPYWRLTEASCELAITGLAENSYGFRRAAAAAARGAQVAAEAAESDAGYRLAKAQGSSLPWEIPACAEEYSAGAAKAAAKAAVAAAKAFRFVDPDRDAGQPWHAATAAKAAAEAAWQAARGWQTAALAISGREQAAAEAAGEEALDAYFETVNHPAHLARMGAIFVTDSFPEIAYRRMFDRLLDEIAATKPEMTEPR